MTAGPPSLHNPAALLEVRVEELRHEADGVLSIVLRGLDSALPPWEPGAHIGLVLPNRVERQYSLIESDPTTNCYRIAVLLDPLSRGGSEYIHYFLRPGQTVRMRSPRNNFVLPQSPTLVFIAGGIGITPILPMIGAAEDSGARWGLHYGGRSASSMAFTACLVAHGPRVRLWPEDETGRMPLDEIIERSGADAAFVCCGPEPLLVAVEEAVARGGRPVSSLHVERFKPRPRPPQPNRACTIRAITSGRTIEVDADTSLLDGLLRAGIQVTASCRSGVCGTCEVEILDGRAEHRDDVLTSEQREAGHTMMVCVSRAMDSEISLHV